jgi:Zn ribbon nucleic-acid-binding protein
MAKTGRVIGHAQCPYCEDAHAEVKLDKNGHPYIVCFDCGGDKKPCSQHFTLGDSKLVSRFFGGGKFKPLAGAELPECLQAVTAPGKPAPAPSPSPAPAPKKTTMLG